MRFRGDAFPHLLLLLVGVFAFPLRVLAHPPLADYIEHQVAVTVSATNIDIAVALVFHDMRSLLERRRMDANRDGIISPDEVRRYLAAMTDAWEDGLIVTFAGRPIALSLLSDPRLDLAGNPAAMGVRHALRLNYFGRTPRVSHDTVIQIENRLWAESAATCFMDVMPSGRVRRDGPASLEIWLPRKDAEPRILTFFLYSWVGAPRDRSTLHQESPHAPATRPGMVPALRPDMAAVRDQRR